MTLTRYGLSVWLTATIVLVGAVIALLAIGWWWLAILPGALWLFVLWFFRDPVRPVPAGLPDGIMIAPADGIVSTILKLDEHPAVDGPAVLVRIFLSVLDVHVNRSPCDATVVSTKHTSGKFVDATRPESADLNESNLIVLRTAHGEKIGVKQIAGKIARRIVCPIKPGDKLRQAQRFGMIRFGSTTELILPRPDDARVFVSVGERVVGGLTQLAMLAPARTSPDTTRASAGAVTPAMP
jgi:phosphatidylserine decarboxylase